MIIYKIHSILLKKAPTPKPSEGWRCLKSNSQIIIVLLTHLPCYICKTTPVWPFSKNLVTLDKMCKTSTKVIPRCNNDSILHLPYRTHRMHNNSCTIEVLSYESLSVKQEIIPHFLHCS